VALGERIGEGASGQKVVVDRLVSSFEEHGVYVD
jgi:hypothetical protein